MSGHVDPKHTQHLHILHEIPGLVELGVRLLHQHESAGAEFRCELAKIVALLQKGNTAMATTTERLEAISTVMDEVAADITELVKKSQQQPPPPAEDFEAALVKLEGKVSGAAAQYKADPVVDTGGGATDPGGNPATDPGALSRN